MVTAKRRPKQLGQILLEQGLLSEDQLDRALEEHRNTPKSLGRVLIDLGYIRERDLVRALAEQVGLEFVDLTEYRIDPVVTSLLPEALSRRYRAIPIGERDGKLLVAMSDPANVYALDDIRSMTGRDVQPLVATANDVEQAIQKYSGMGDQVEALASEAAESAEEDMEAAGVEAAVEDAPIVKLVTAIMTQAAGDRASDVHIEPTEKDVRVRFRVDGVLHEVMHSPKSIQNGLISRLKVMADLNIAEKRVPQDGRMKLALSAQRGIDFRVSTLPTLFGEKVVMRILDASQAKMGIDALGYEPEQRAVLIDAIKRPYGMVLVTGPTGSGKTVSLYTCLSILNQPGVNISTAEDPAEIQLAGINQVNVNEKAGLTFANAMRSFLRQDPDIIMVGEIRDLETADIAVKAAQTGHMVMSTLHTNDAPSTLTRLANMGVPPFNIASSVILITAQRLARRLCGCKQPADFGHDALLAAGFARSDLDGSWVPHQAVGCERCKGSGYKGRVGIYEVMPITEAIQHIILKGGSSIEIAQQAQREGVKNLRQSGLLKVKQGVTSLEEVLGCTNE